MNSHIDCLSYIRFCKLVVRLEAKEHASLSAFTINGIRSWLGPALLRNEFCSFLREDTCPPCISPSGCTFHLFFEGKTSQTTKPYVIDVLTPQNKWRLNPGDSLEIQMTLIGEGTLHQDKVAVAYMRFDNEVKLFGSRFKLTDIKTSSASDESTLFQVGKRNLISLAELIATEEFTALQSAQKIRIDYVTPTSLLQGGRLLKGAQNLTFDFLIRRLLRRLYLLAVNHCGYRDGQVPVSDLMDKARGVKTLYSNLRWREYDRYSKRQQQEQTFGGYIGCQEFIGDLEEFAPLLILGEHLHVGRRATFGFGKFRVGLLA